MNAVRKTVVEALIRRAVTVVRPSGMVERRSVRQAAAGKPKTGLVDDTYLALQRISFLLGGWRL